MKRIKNIVCLGGGNAMPETVLAGLKRYPVKLIAISATLDTGGSAGRLREGFGGISFGDIRRAVLALSEADQKTKDYFAYRDWDGQVVANTFCAAMMAATGNPEKTIEKLRERLKVPSYHQILPVTLDNANICAILENNQVVVGESNIDIPKHNGNLKIKKVYLEPKAKAYPKVLEAIKKADLIVIGPGDLYSSLAHILLVDGVSTTLKRSKAKKVYICNLMTKHGETNNFQVADFVREVEKLLKRKLDFVIYNTKEPTVARLVSYKKEHPELLEIVENKVADSRFIGQDLLTPFGSISHQPDKLAKTVLSLCKP